MHVWTDEFKGGQLNERWKWFAPSGGSYELGNGWLTISVPRKEKGFNHWSGVFEAPMLLTNLPDGDWAAETTAQITNYEPDSDFHVGMAVAVSERYLWLWGIFYSATVWKMQKPELWLERTGEARLLQVPLTSDGVNLRVEKRGWWLHFFWRTEEQGDWQEAGKSLIWFAPKQIGLIVKTFGEGRPLSTRFGRFKLESLEITALPLEAKVTVNSACYALLEPYYRLGADTAQVGGAQRWFGWEAYNRYLLPWLTAGQKLNWGAIGFTAGGFLFVWLLYLLRVYWVGSPFHPVGYAISGTWSMEMVWFPLFLAWLAKALVLRYGTFRDYYSISEFFIGLVIGDFVSGGLWNVYGTIIGREVYRFNE